VISVKEENQVGKEMSDEDASLAGQTRLSKELRLSRDLRSKEMSPESMRGMIIPGRQNNKCKDPEAEASFLSL
jgi:hypothetical protein